LILKSRRQQIKSRQTQHQSSAFVPAAVFAFSFFRLFPFFSRPFLLCHLLSLISSSFIIQKKSKGTKVLFERTDAFFHFSAYFTVFLNF
ncbi:hypothetical protein, partial [Enterococcus faecium]|uniref:hypothetical protein n=1 Tax=Enterococcus faecium TaxID=1352 RepID=UPI0034E945BE